MKLFFTTISFILFTMVSYAQFPTMNISHQGLAPYDTLTVYAGDSITFVYGGGGPHPMTEGWQTGETSEPIPFPTVTVTSGDPIKTFALETPGTYYFHCGTNPMNSANWGKITVVENTATSVEETITSNYTIYPNPATSTITIKGLSSTGKIFDLSGREVMKFNNQIVDIESLEKGTYLIRIEIFSTFFIKN